VGPDNSWNWPFFQESHLVSGVLPSINTAGANPPQSLDQTGITGVSNSMSPDSTNAAGTSENVAMHVAVIVALALIGVFVLRQSGFRFVVGAGAGVG